LWVRAVVFESRTFVRSAVRRRDRERRVAVPLAVVDAETADRVEEISAALDELSQQQREVLVLTYWDDLQPSAVAVVLDVSEGSVRKQLARARARMKEALR